jgi:hypothetical protein
MVNYCARFIKDLSTIAKPLRELTKKGIPLKWEQEHQIANSLTSNNAMSYFDRQKKTEVIVDASPVGLGFILVQGNESRKILLPIHVLECRLPLLLWSSWVSDEIPSPANMYP